MEKMQLRIDAGLLSDRFPGVSIINISMTYYQKGINPVLMKRTVNVYPTSYAYFNMECMTKGCVDGGFDLDRIISNLIRGHKESGEGELVCDGNNISSGHAKIDYKVTIQYSSSAR